MKAALELAQQGMGLASPNPCVGAIVVDELGRIVGRGVHKYAERKHAEVIAIEAAGPLARGNTLYLNLEPCCHTGRTGPCTEAIIAAGVGRVVAAMRDPNPAIAGKGFEQLRAAGIDVVEGILEAEARKLNEAFARYIRTGVPFVTLKTAMSLDGRIALPPRGKAVTPSTTYLIGVSALRQVHLLRHASDAIMVGIGTALADDPLLTDRSGLERRRPLLRVVLDSELRLPLDSRIVASAANARDVVVFCCRAGDEAKHALESRGVRVEVVPALPSSAQPMAAGPTLDLHCVLKTLGEMHITSVLLEGGAKVNGAFLRAGLVDKVWLFYAPKIFGSGVPLASNEDGSVPEVNLLPETTLHRYDDDFAVEGYLRDPYK